MPDFRAAERTFSLITQVAGRAGRFFPDGEVIVQSYDPERIPIACACTGQTDVFYAEELRQRKMLGFPPFSRLIRLVFRAATESAAESSAEQAAAILRQSMDTFGKTQQTTAELLGPSECPIEKIAMNYRWQILLRSRNIGLLQKMCAHLIYDFNRPQDVYIEADVDPVNLL
jgi:primosomal protein N' (replication factor Y)